mmetsp:Transcript_24587/g.61866  ORF Transcript_24587/g.61866 Transcript_24587/m.61866 type:complete len:256 (+) Transcript_24587:2961-3728(+)
MLHDLLHRVWVWCSYTRGRRCRRSCTTRSRTGTSGYNYVRQRLVTTTAHAIVKMIVLQIIVVEENVPGGDVRDTTTRAHGVVVCVCDTFALPEHQIYDPQRECHDAEDEGGDLKPHIFLEVYQRQRHRKQQANYEPLRYSKVLERRIHVGLQRCVLVKDAVYAGEFHTAVPSPQFRDEVVNALGRGHNRHHVQSLEGAEEPHRGDEREPPARHVILDAREEFHPAVKVLVSGNEANALTDPAGGQAGEQPEDYGG